jgi:hypothetical protein
MSEYMYRVRYDRHIIAAATEENPVDVQAQIRELLRQLGAAPLPSNGQALPIERIQARPLAAAEMDTMNLPEGMVEVPVLDNLINAAVQEETLFLKAVSEDELLIAVTDASLQATQCDQIVLNLAKKLYMKGTGEEVSDEEIEIERVGILAYTLCQYCRSAVAGLPYRCPHCSRIYCRSHVAPVSHHCGVTASQHTTQANSSPTHKTVTQPEAKPHQPRISIGKVPCG